MGRTMASMKPSTWPSLLQQKNAAVDECGRGSCAEYPSRQGGVAMAQLQPLQWIARILIGVSDTPRSPDRAPPGPPPGPPGRPQPLPADAEIELTGADLSIADVEAVARGGRRV